MTEQELIKIAKNNFYKLKNIDRKLITKKVIDEMEVCNDDWYHHILKGIDPNTISKQKALEFLKYDKELYSLLTKELQEDKDILEITTCDINRLPKCIFDNKVAVNYVLDKWNVDGKSWAVCDFERQAIVIKRDINKKKYIAYRYVMLAINENTNLGNDFYNHEFKCIEEETFLLFLNRGRIPMGMVHNDKHLD